MKTLKIKFISYIIFLLPALFNFGCSKSDDLQNIDSGHYMRFKIDGKQYEYTDAPFEVNLIGNFNRVSSGDSYGSSFGGQRDHSENEKNILQFLITNKSELQENVTYSNGPSTANKIEPELFLMSYQNESGVIFSTINNRTLIPDGGVLDAELIYTEVTDTYLKGKFSGTLYDENDNAIKILEGSFSVKRNL